MNKVQEWERAAGNGPVVQTMQMYRYGGGSQAHGASVTAGSMQVKPCSQFKQLGVTVPE